MPWESKRQQRWGHGRGGKKAGFTKEKIKEWDEKTDFESLPEEAPKSKSSLAFNWAIAGEPPFPGAAPPFGSKSEDDEVGSDTEETEAALATRLSWATFALEALPDSMTDAPGDHDEAVDHSEDGEARDTSVLAHYMLLDTAFNACLVGNCLGFMTNALRSVVAQPGITSPISKLPPAPPGAAERAKQRKRAGRGIEGEEISHPTPPGAANKAKQKQRAGRGVEGDEGVDPMSTLDKFNWDNLPLPGMGQISLH